ncbi:MAG: WbuC family cupin fold metalloprotein [Verrucomicrobia bacterium]|nr:WbuC family cupin fold metalloprotein [Verrucomicrobiota bacterium]
MKTRKFNDEVLYPGEAPVVLDRAFVEWLKQQADRNPRRRIRLCAHQDPNDLIHEMLIVHAQMTYIRPHKHLTRIESFQVLEGEADMVMFDEQGAITRVIRMGPYGSGHPFYYRLTEPVYHTLLIYSPHLVFKEVTNGPFNRADTVFPAWAPEDSQPEGAERFMRDLQQKVRSRPPER